MLRNRKADITHLEEPDKVILRASSFIVGKFTRVETGTRVKKIKQRQLDELQKLIRILNKIDLKVLNSSEEEARKPSGLNSTSNSQQSVLEYTVYEYIMEVSALTTTDDLIEVNKRYDLAVIQKTMDLFSRKSELEVSREDSVQINVPSAVNPAQAASTPASQKSSTAAVMGKVNDQPLEKKLKIESKEDKTAEVNNPILNKIEEIITHYKGKKNPSEKDDLILNFANVAKGAYEFSSLAEANSTALNTLTNLTQDFNYKKLTRFEIRDNFFEKTLNEIKQEKKAAVSNPILDKIEEIITHYKGKKNPSEKDGLILSTANLAKGVYESSSLAESNSIAINTLMNLTRNSNYKKLTRFEIRDNFFEKTFNEIKQISQASQEEKNKPEQGRKGPK